MTLQIAVLGSTRGTAIQSTMDEIERGALNANIAIVISDKRDAVIIERAKKRSIPTCFIDPAGFSRDEYDALITEALKKSGAHLVLLVGYMRILSKQFVSEWQNKVLNVHPSLLPKHGGLMDKAVHKAVLDAGDEISGCTIHYVEEAVDSGEILLQKTCEIDALETVDSLKEKVQRLEQHAFIDAIKMIGEKT